MTALTRVVIAYVPVLHAGYVGFFKRQVANGAQALYVLADGVLDEFPHLRKDLRRLRNGQSAAAVNALGIFERVDVADVPTLQALCRAGKLTVVMPDEEESRSVAAAYLAGCDVEYDPVFLRWNKQNVEHSYEVVVDRLLAPGSVELEFVRLASGLAGRSMDWWRQVGAVCVRDGNVLLANWNKHVPDERQHLYDGDPRGLYRRGEGIESSTVLHCEARVVAEAAERGIAIGGTDLYVTTFPCPPCAKLVAYSGIRRVYFVDGYAVLDGERILRDRNVEIVRVQPPG
jgi:dCMP deaminase